MKQLIRKCSDGEEPRKYSLSEKPLAEIASLTNLLSRAELAQRWSVCRETVKRMEKQGRLPALCLGPRLKRYKLEDVLRVEAEMQGGGK